MGGSLKRKEKIGASVMAPNTVDKTKRTASAPARCKRQKLPREYMTAEQCHARS